MPSPFPGMDPYMESPDEWKSIHTRLITRIGDALSGKLDAAGSRYRAQVQESLFLHDPPAPRRKFAEADDCVVVGVPDHFDGGGNGVALAEPSLRVKFEDALGVERYHYVEVRTGREERVVTVIELLSPTNKQHADSRATFLNKRVELVRNGVNFLQIDLLRGGPRLLTPEVAPHDYDAMLIRGDSWDAAIWLWSLRDPLPTLPVPLLKPDGDVALDLQSVLNETYDAANLRPFIYRRPPVPPLDAGDAGWAEQRLVSAGVEAA